MICDSRIVGDRNGKYRVGSVCPFSPVLSYLTLNIAVFKPLISLVLREGIFSKIPLQSVFIPSADIFLSAEESPFKSPNNGTSIFGNQSSDSTSAVIRAPSLKPRIKASFSNTVSSSLQEFFCMRAMIFCHPLDFFRIDDIIVNEFTVLKSCRLSKMKEIRFKSGATAITVFDSKRRRKR